MTRIHQLTVEDALASVKSGREGLSAREADRRLREYGPNEVEAVYREPLVRRFFKSFTHFFALILWVAAGLAFFAEAREPGQGMLVLGGAIVGVIVINGAFSFWQEYRAERALDALQRLLPPQARVRRDGSTAQAPASCLVPGDVLYLEAGDRVPADCRVIEAFALRVNNATVTGESMPHARDTSPSSEPDFLHSSNVLLAGTSVVAGDATALVFATGTHTAFGQIAHLTQAGREPLSPLQREVVQLSRLVSLLALGLGVAFFFVGRAIGLPFWSNFIFAIGIIVANVPEGLLPTLTLALAMGSQRMARRNALIRHLPAVETLGAATVICTDKTGTLTENRLTVKRLWQAGQSVEFPEVTKAPLLTGPHGHLLQIARHCHSLKPAGPSGSRSWLGDPLEIALRELAEKIEPGAVEFPRLDELPFDSRRRRMSTLHECPEGAVLFAKGAPEAVLPLCHQLDSSHGAVTLDDEWRARIMAAQNAMAQAGLRVLALAWRKVALPGVAGKFAPRPDEPVRTSRSADGARAERLEAHLTFAGLVGLEDPPRPEVPAAIARCREAGIRVIMITGDHAHTALAVAREIGLVKSVNPVVVAGEQLRHLSNTQLQLTLDAPEVIFARVAADQKMRIVTALKRKNEIVAVTGDGVNDAPALKKADIGISMGRCGTDVARESADMILLDDNFATIVAAIEEGRAVYANIRKFLTYILTSNIPELVPYLAFVLFQIPLPLTIIQILAVDLGTDMLPALALGAEPPGPQSMKEPPRPRRERLLNIPLMARAYLWLGPLQAVAAMAAFLFVLHGGGWHHGQRLAAHDPLYLRATTACLCAIVVMQVANVFVCRSRRRSVFSFRFAGNPLLRYGLLVEISLILAITYTPWGNFVFGTAPIPLTAWLFMLPFAAGMVALEELRKWWLRRREGKAGGAATVSGPVLHSTRIR